jgi:SAM-dependent methyltransferase
VITAYGVAEAAGWSSGAGAVYEPLAASLVATCPIGLVGSRVLDAGSGTGAAASLLAAAGAAVTACDLSPSMITSPSRRSWPAAVADVAALPLRTASFDAAVAAFLLNHLEPIAGLRELGRVVRPGGAVLASTWAAGADPVKSAIDAIFRAGGWRPPVWYLTMKTVIEPISGDPEELRAAATRAGLMDVSVTRRVTDLGLRDPLAIVSYRAATPHIFPWLATLDTTTRSRLIDAAAVAIEPLAAAWRPAVLFLRATAGRPPG